MTRAHRRIPTITDTGRRPRHTGAKEPAGVYTVTATFAEDNQYLGSTDSKPFTVTLEETSLAYTGDTHLATGTPAHLRGLDRGWRLAEQRTFCGADVGQRHDAAAAHWGH